MEINIFDIEAKTKKFESRNLFFSILAFLCIIFNNNKIDNILIEM